MLPRVIVVVVVEDELSRLDGAASHAQVRSLVEVHVIQVLQEGVVHHVRLVGVVLADRALDLRELMGIELFKVITALALPKVAHALVVEVLGGRHLQDALEGRVALNNEL